MCLLENISTSTIKEYDNLAIVNFIIMKTLCLPLFFSVALLVGGCSAIHQSAQTVDDVYYSDGNLPIEKARSQRTNNAELYSSYWENEDDNYLRMKVRNGSRWNTIDDLDYWYGLNNYNHYGSWNSNNFWQQGWGWNGFNSNPWGNLGWSSWANQWNNPWCWNRPVIIINKYPTGNTNANLTSRPSSGLGGYSNNNYTRSGGIANTGKPGTSRSIWDNKGTNSGSGQSQYRTVDRSSGNSFERPVRTFDNSSSSGNSGSSRTSGGSSSSSSSSSSSRGGRGR